MSLQRPTILAAILCVLVVGYTTQQLGGRLPLPWQSWSATAVPNQPPPLPGKNTVAGLIIQRNADGQWQAEFDYFYTGAPYPAVFRVSFSDSKSPVVHLGSERVKRGKHHVVMELPHPGPDIIKTRGTVLSLAHVTGTPIATATDAQALDWPDLFHWLEDQKLAGMPREELYTKAVELIDTGRSDATGQAKMILERIIKKDPKFAPAYIELARVAMKTNWGPEGLHQGEQLLESALSIDPDSANAKILLGYVYAHQRHFPKAERLFAEAAQSKPEPTNLWLWANWGEVLVMQGKLDAAEVKYREAVTRPRTHATYDRARRDAYNKLIALLERRKDFTAAEALYKQRMTEFTEGCHKVSYAEFLLEHDGELTQIMQLAENGLNDPCGKKAARQVLGVSHYAAWAAATGDARSTLLNKARIFLPAGPELLYLLAKRERTLAAAKQLMAVGEKIDQKDNENMTALAYALRDDDLPTTKRLLRLGSRPDAAVGDAEIPVAFLPIITGNVEAVRVLQKNGVDYSQLKHQGVRGVDIAKQLGRPEILDVLVEKPPMT